MTTDKPTSAKIKAAMAQLTADARVAAESASKKFAAFAAATKRP